MYEQFMGDFTYRDSGSRQVQFIFLRFVNFRATIILFHLLYFSTYSGIKTLFLIVNACHEHNILDESCYSHMWMFIKPRISYFVVRKFVCVHREAQQIFMALNTEYRANLVKTRVNVPITLLHVYWVCLFKLFLISQGWEGFTPGGGTWVFFGWVCAARDSKMAPRSGKNFP